MMDVKFAFSILMTSVLMSQIAPMFQTLHGELLEFSPRLAPEQRDEQVKSVVQIPPQERASSGGPSSSNKVETKVLTQYAKNIGPWEEKSPMSNTLGKPIIQMVEGSTPFNEKIVPRKGDPNTVPDTQITDNNSKKIEKQKEGFKWPFKSLFKSPVEKKYRTGLSSRFIAESELHLIEEKLDHLYPWLGKYDTSMYNLNKVLEIYKVNGSRVRERVTRYIIVYLNNLPLKYIQIDELTKTLNDILTFGNLSLYDKAHLSFSLYSFEKYHDEEVREKILEFAVKLENSCRSDPDIFRIIWSGEPLEEEQVIRDLLDPMLSLTQANFDEICKTSSWRAPWAHNIITDNGAYKTSKELLTFIPPEKIAEKMTTALTTLVYSTKYPTPGTQYPSTWDYMYLMKTIYIYQQYFEPMLKDPEFKELKALGDHDWGLLLEAINQCKDSFKLYQISRAPSKVVQMAKAYTDIIYSFSGSKSLIECPGLIEVWIRMADSQQLAPTSKTPKTILEFFQSISGIKSHERLIEKIKGIGEIDSEIPSFHGDHEYLYSKQLLKFLQYLWMNYYINDEIDFQVKEAITWKAFEAYKKIQEPYSETLVAALIGRLEAMYPGKKGRIDHLIEVLAFRNDYIIW